MAAKHASHRLAAALGHDFSRPELLAQALTHPSTGKGAEFERLEFLGDRVLGLAVAEMLLAAFAHEPEGALSRRLTQLVRGETIAQIARNIGLGEALELSKGEDDSGRRAGAGMLADAAEAVIGALFLDGGMDAARRFIVRHWQPLMEAELTPPKDAKTELQEYLQGRGLPPPNYETISVTGPSHGPTIAVRVMVPGPKKARGGSRSTIAEATGASRRAAEQEAARRLLALLKGKA